MLKNAFKQFVYSETQEQLTCRSACQKGQRVGVLKFQTFGCAGHPGYLSLIFLGFRTQSAQETRVAHARRDSKVEGRTLEP